MLGDWRQANVAPVFKTKVGLYAEICQPLALTCICFKTLEHIIISNLNQRTNGPVNAHLISWPSQAQNLENIW